MAQSSAMVSLGTPLPEFALPEPATGKTVRSGDFPGDRPLLVVFICNHCPYVKHVLDGLLAFGRDYADRLHIVGIAANDPGAYPEDGPDAIKQAVAGHDFPFPYLFDESQETAKAFRAVCTPDFFLYGPDRTLAYRGQFDDSRPDGDQPATGADLRAAADAVLAGKPAPEPQKPSSGCGIKWRPGNEPDYAG